MVIVKYLAYSIESQLVSYMIQVSVVEFFFRQAAGLRVPRNVNGGMHSKQFCRLVRIYSKLHLIKD